MNWCLRDNWMIIYRVLYLSLLIVILGLWLDILYWFISFKYSYLDIDLDFW